MSRYTAFSCLSSALLMLCSAAPSAAEGQAPPFESKFTVNDDDLADYTVIDANNDGRTWNWSTRERPGLRASYNTDHVTPMDDWLVSKALFLQAGMTYNLRFRACVQQTDCPEIFEVKFSRGNTLEALTSTEKPPVTIVGRTEINNLQPQDFYASFTPEEDGDYHLAFHCISEPDRYYLYLDEVSLHVAGADLPSQPANLRLEETGTPGEVKISWDPVSADLYGNPIPADDISYNVYLYGLEFDEWNEYRTGTKETSFTLSYPGAEESQTIGAVAVEAVCSEGTGRRAATDKTGIGRPYTYLRESFSNTSFHYAWLRGGTAERNTIFTDNTLGSVSSFDADNGYVAIRGSLGQSAFIQSGKIDLEGMSNPGISFHTYYFVSDDGYGSTNEIKVEARVPGGDFREVDTIVIADVAGDSSAGWVKCSVPLADYKDKTVELRLTGTICSFSYVMIDNLVVDEMIMSDLSIVSTEQPISVRAGADFKVTCDLSNAGAVTAEGWKAELYADGALLTTLAGTALAPGRNMRLEFPLTMNALRDTPCDYRIEIVSADDEEPADNRTEFRISPIPSVHPAPAGLSGSRREGVVTLRWSAPALGTQPVAVTEDFEKAPAFSREYGDWTMLDMDKTAVGGFNEFAIPGIVNKQSLASFFLFEPAELKLDSQFEPHSGSRFLASLVLWNDAQVDDWAVSPELSGAPQTVTFWARSFQEQYPEKVEVLCSDGSLEPADFKTVMPAATVPGKWTQYSVDIPDGAQRFAFRSCAAGNFMLMLDDVTYEGMAPAKKYEVKGYNVYRDGVRLNASPLAEPGYTDATAGSEEHDYRVTALYAQGESKPSAKGEIDDSGVHAVFSGDTPGAAYYNLQGIRVERPAPGNVYIRVTGDRSERILFR